ncbi:MAG: 3'-5' exonuclease [Pseudomonadota bacterium]|nr:3'-5' exonuclease [Pseudomonadota bacterium]
MADCSAEQFIEKIENHILRPDGFRIADWARRIHGVSEQQAQQYGRPIKEILQRLASDIQSIDELVIIGHNVDFDRKVIGSEFSRYGFNVDIFKFPFICAMQSATSICRIPRANGSGYKYPKLQELYLHLFGENFSDTHTSKADVEATARCYFELARRGLLPMPSGREIKNPDNIQNKKRQEQKSSLRPEISSDYDVQFHRVDSTGYQQGKKKNPNTLIWV